MRRVLPVCTSVRHSDNSSSVPKPPGSTTYADAKRTNIILREKKYRKSSETSWKLRSPFSWGNEMLRPIDGARPACAPLFAASMRPGPPPEITEKPASESLRAIVRETS